MRLFDIHLCDDILESDNLAFLSFLRQVHLRNSLSLDLIHILVQRINLLMPMAMMLPSMRILNLDTLIFAQLEAVLMMLDLEVRLVLAGDGLFYARLLMSYHYHAGLV